ncbi:MAG: ADOP family duplicated permease [Gemmatimonas sp.]
MSLWRHLKHGLRALFNPSGAKRDADDEVRHFLEQSVAAHEARGLTRADAERAARMEVGSSLDVTEQMRDDRWESVLEHTLLDLRYAWRSLAKHPVFAAIAVLSLGFGIGATTTVFSVIDALDLRALPYRDANRLVWLSELTPRNYNLCFPGKRCPFYTGAATANDWIAQSRSYESLSAVSTTSFTWQQGDAVENSNANQATPGLFGVLGVRPLLGREFVAADTMAGAQQVLMVTYAFWKTRLGGDEKIVGKPLLSYYGNARAPALSPITIVGVLPQDFEYPGVAQAWTPLALPATASRKNREISVIGKLKHGVTIDAANTELATINARLARAYPATSEGWDANVLPLRQLIQFSTAGSTRYTLFAITAVVLLIAALNVAGLLLARGIAREPEFAMRSALGAGRVRVVRQLLVEGGVVGVLGGVVGVMLAFWGVRFVGQWFGVTNSGVAIGVDLRVLTFGLATSLLVGVAAAIAPAFRASRTDLSEAFKRRTMSGPRGARYSNALIGLQVAFGLVLLTAAGILSADFLEVRYRDLGYDPGALYYTTFTGNAGQWKDPAGWKQMSLDTRAEVARVPGIASVGIEYRNAMSPAIVRAVSAGADRPASETPSVVAVDQGYFASWGVSVLQGRLFAERDAAGAALVAVVNKAAADVMWPRKNPVGQLIFVGDSGSLGELLSVVGVTRDVERGERHQRHWPMVYRPFVQARIYHPATRISIRLPSGRADVIAAAQSAVRRATGQVTSPFLADESALDKKFLTKRFNAVALNLFAGFALLLAAMGIYGSVAYSVTQRNREIGIRIAIGANRGNVLALVARRGVVTATAGVAIGVIGSVALARLLKSFVIGTSVMNPWIFAGSALLMIAVALTATLLPARHATRIDPVVALRAD